MKAVILAGGEGTRLRPLTCNTPKVMVPILNRPFIEHAIHYLRKHSIEEIILATGYRPDSIQSFLGDGTQFGVRLSYVVEESPLGTAGAVKNAESFLDGPFIVLNGDILTEIDLAAMMRCHREIKPKVSIALTPVDNPIIYGIVETDAQGRVRRFLEKPSWDEVTTNMINAGIYILEPEVLAYIPASDPFMFEDYLFPRLLELGEPIFGYHSDAYWIDIGTPEKYLKAHHDLLRRWGSRSVRTKGRGRIHPEARIEEPVLVAEECVIAGAAQVKGPAVLEPRCEVAKDAVIEGAVLWHDSKVGERAVLRNCIVGSRCYIKENCYVPDGCVLGDKVILETGSNIAVGTRIEPDTYLRTNADVP